MGKNQRNKKVQRLEKAKTKLKVTKTKFLPKGTNVTDVNFKIKPIVLSEQLKSKNINEILTKRNLNIKDLLTRLNHYNKSFRKEGCEGLLELVTINEPEFIELNLRELLQGVCKLVLDREKDVRHKAIKLISSILGKIAAIKVTSFCNILVSYTTCAMTDIDINVQEDSLLLIDAFLDKVPIVLLSNVNKIISNFLTLISKLRSESNPSRTLSINLGSKLTSIRWRIKVLKRLLQILEIILSSRPETKEQKRPITLNAADVGIYIPIYKKWKVGYSYIFDNSSENNNNLLQYADAIIPLLYETWAEVAPINKNNIGNGNLVIEQDAASILNCTIGIFYLLWELQDNTNEDTKRLFLTKENQRFFHHLLNQFPYIHKGTSGKIKSKTNSKLFFDVHLDAKCVRENLLISYMFSVLYKNLTNNYQCEKAKSIVAYLRSCLVNRKYVTFEDMELLLNTLRVIFLINSKVWLKRGIDIKDLLESVIIYQNNLSHNKTEVLILLADIIHLPHINGLKEYQEWLGSLPSLLCKPKISGKVVDVLSILSRQNNNVFLDALREQLPKILDNLPLIEINSTSEYPDHLKIVSMFSFIPVFTFDLLSILGKFVNEHKHSIQASYVEELLKERLRFHQN